MAQRNPRQANELSEAPRTIDIQFHTVQLALIRREQPEGISFAHV
jgi:hypothetical protein